MIPSLSLKRIKEIDREFEIFLNSNNPSVTNKTTRYMARNENGLGMLKINAFWRAIRMSWLKRLTSSKSTWANLHRAETKTCTFDPITSNMEELIKAKNMTKNLVWRDIYDSLLTCRRNIIHKHPNEFLSIPINGETMITNNFNPVSQPWCSRLMIKDILTHHGDWKDVNDYYTVGEVMDMSF